mmetsp:Transcript_31408/g.71763  ORF Transcript_31408/g.71763 Transcript_31408/m.71763 type:complete len:99 (-) Transcript_31408:19-315(-)
MALRTGDSSWWSATTAAASTVVQSAGEAAHSEDRGVPAAAGEHREDRGDPPAELHSVEQQDRRLLGGVEEDLFVGAASSSSAKYRKVFLIMAWGVDLG